MTRHTIHFSGNVQGVGFRHSTRQTAGRFDVTGYVQNLSDGRVRLVTEGQASELQAFLDALRQRMGRYIQDEQRDEGPATGEFDTFEVRH